MYQKLIVVGNLGGDPELKYMDDGTALCSFSLATNRRWNNAQGQQVDETTWFRVSVWGKQAEVANQYLTKGSKLLVEGRLKPDPATGGPKTFTKKDGTVGATFEVICENFTFVGSKGDNTNETLRQATPAPRQQAAEPQFFENEEDIPF